MTKHFSKKKVKGITYWITTGFIVFELTYGATWDFNWLNKGFAQDVMKQLGFPAYLPAILGISKLIAAVCIGMPRLPLVKEWAYTGVMILFIGAVCSHIITGYNLAVLIFLFVCITFTVLSYCLRPDSRKIVL